LTTIDLVRLLLYKRGWELKGFHSLLLFMEFVIMGLFKNGLTELEILIKESFNFEDKEEYNFEIETEGKFVKIEIPVVTEVTTEGEDNGNNIPSRPKLPNK
jgi:hypothetical protein